MFYLYWRVLFLFVREEEGQLDKPYPTPAKILGLLSKPGPCCTAPTVFLGFFCSFILVVAAWKRSAEQRYPRMRRLKNCTPSPFINSHGWSLCCLVTYETFSFDPFVAVKSNCRILCCLVYKFLFEPTLVPVFAHIFILSTSLVYTWVDE